MQTAGTQENLSPSAQTQIRERAEALFASALQPSELAPMILPSGKLSRRGVTFLQGVVMAAVCSCGGIRGCVNRMSTEFGDHPEDAAARMRWALSVAAMVPNYRTIPPRAPVAL
jgi:hypothetical protein